MIDEAVRRWGRLDILDNNVGIEGRGTLLETDETQWEKVMRVNVLGSSPSPASWPSTMPPWASG